MSLRALNHQQRMFEAMKVQPHRVDTPAQVGNDKTSEAQLEEQILELTKHTVTRLPTLELSPSTLVRHAKALIENGQEEAGVDAARKVLNDDNDPVQKAHASFYIAAGSVIRGRTQEAREALAQARQETSWTSNPINNRFADDLQKEIDALARS